MFLFKTFLNELSQVDQKNKPKKDETLNVPTENLGILLMLIINFRLT